MFNSVSSFLRSAWEIAYQFTGSGISEPSDPSLERFKSKVFAGRVKLPLAKIMQKAPLVETGGYWVPKNIIQLIFRQLPPEELLKVGLVCRVWYQIASSDSLWNSYDLKEVFPQATFIDRGVWEAYIDLEKNGLILEGEGRPCVDKWDYIDLKRIELEVVDKMGISILTLPKGTSFNKIAAFAGSPKMGNPVEFSYISQRLDEEFRDREIEETITVVITNCYFKHIKVRNPSWVDVELEALECKRPKIVPLASLAMMRFIISDPESPIRLFGAYVSCEEKIDGFNVALGGFDKHGPNVMAGEPLRPDASYGKAGMRKLKVIRN